MDDSKLNQNSLKSFVRNLCVLAKKNQDSGKARIELRKRMESLKRFTSKKKEMDEELDQLHDMMDMVLEKESELLRIYRGDRESSKELSSNVTHNKDQISQIKESVEALKQRMEDYINVKTARDKKVMALEKKIKEKTKTSRDVSLLKRRLKDLEGMYAKLKKKGVDVSRVEGKIDDLKLRLSAA